MCWLHAQKQVLNAELVEGERGETRERAGGTRVEEGEGRPAAQDALYSQTVSKGKTKSNDNSFQKQGVKEKCNEIDLDKVLGFVIRGDL